MSEWFVEAANHCCGNFDYGEDEMVLSGLTALPSVKAREAHCAACRLLAHVCLPWCLALPNLAPHASRLLCSAGAAAAGQGVCCADGV